MADAFSVVLLCEEINFPPEARATVRKHVDDATRAMKEARHRQVRDPRQTPRGMLLCVLAVGSTKCT